MVTKKFLVEGIMYTVSLAPQTTEQYTVTLSSYQGTKTFSITIKAWHHITHELTLEYDNKKVCIAKITQSNIHTFLINLFNQKPEILVEEPHQGTKTIIQHSSPFFPAISLESKTDNHSSLSLKSPLGGRVIKVLVKQGDSVIQNQPLCVIESMKMENEICSPYTAHIKTLSIAPGNVVQPSQVLITFERKGECDATPKNEYQQKEV